MSVVVTGGAGCIGGDLCRRLLERGDAVWAVDDFDPFYDPALKRETVRELSAFPAFRLVEADACGPGATRAGRAAAGGERFDATVHLAARVGVRPSIREPLKYARANVEGTATVLELSRALGYVPVVLGSSSSVYGNSAPVPFREDDPVVEPISPYAATKRAGERFCHARHALYGTRIAPRTPVEEGIPRFVEWFRSTSR